MASRRGRSIIAAGATFGMCLAGIVTAAPAHADAFSMSLVGGTLTLGSQATLALSPGFACQNGTDDEFMAPFGTQDGLVDYPADPQCTGAYDDDETLAGYQAPQPGVFTGTIDGGSNFSLSATMPNASFVRTSPSPTLGVCDDDLLVAHVTTTFSDLAPHTGNLNAGTLTINFRLDTELDIRCDTDLGAGQTFIPYDVDGAGGMDPWGGATPVDCAQSLSSLNTSASGDSAPASTAKAQDPAVAGPMTGGILKPPLLFGDVFDALPIAGPDTRCGFFNLLLFGTANVDNNAAQWAFIPGTYDYADQPGIDVNVGDVTVPEGDGGGGALGCAGKNCRNTAQVVVSLSSPATVDSTVTVIADNTTGGSANGTYKGTEIVAPGPADYKHTALSKPRVLKIKAGKSTAKFVINIVPDQLIEADETIVVKVTAVSAGLVMNDGAGLVTINDDDDAVEPDTGISIGDATVYETGEALGCGGAFKCKGTAVLTIVAESALLVDTDLSYTVTNGQDAAGVLDAAEAVNGKTAGDDFKPVPIVKIKKIRATKNTTLLVVTIFGDNTDENGAFGGETFTVTVSGAGVRDGVGMIRINNDDT